MTASATTDFLSRLGSQPWLTDGGLETHMVFHEGIDLPQFASFPLLGQARGRQALERYFSGFLDEAEDLGLGFVLDTATWRASAGWGARMGWSAEAIDAVNREAVAFAKALQQGRSAPTVVNGVIGPHGDACRPDEVLTSDGAEAYHRRQIAVLAEAGVDVVSAYPAELALDYAALRQRLPRLRVVGGCCGTDLRHVAAIGRRFADGA